MEQVGFLMHLKKGNEAEYKRRHDEIWPELRVALADLMDVDATNKPIERALKPVFHID